MRSATQDTFFNLEGIQKQLSADQTVLWRLVLLNIPINELFRAKRVCREFNNIISKLIKTHPSIMQAVLCRVGYNDELTIKLLGGYCDPLDSLAIGSKNSHHHSVSIRFTGTVLGCGQLGLNVLDREAPLFIIDDQFQIGVYSYQRGELLGKFAGHRSPVRQQSVMALDLQTIASGDESGNLFVWQLPNVIPPDKQAQISQTLSAENALWRIKGHTAPISVLAKIDFTHFISADDMGVIQFWDTNANTPVKTWHANEQIQFLCYLNSQSVLYMTYTFREKGYQHEFTVWKHKGVEKMMIYRYQHEDRFRLTPLTPLMSQVNPSFALFADIGGPSELSFYQLQQVTEKHQEKVLLAKAEHKNDNPLRCFFSSCSFFGKVSKGVIPSLIKVEIIENLTKYSLPKENTASFVYK